MTVGSSSAIFACGAARLGLRVAFAGVVGDDAFGRFMLDEMAARGIDVSACRVDPARPTGATVILTQRRGPGDAHGHRDDRRARRRRAPARLARAGRDTSTRARTSSRSRVATGCRAFFAAARAAGRTTSFDTNWDPSGRWDGDVLDLLRVADVFLPNAAEARRIAGTDDVEAAALALARTGAAGRSDGGPTSR